MPIRPHFGVIALAVDRRALLVSSLAYVLFALDGLFRQAGAVSLSIALTALVIGSALLLLSAFWHSARRLVVGDIGPSHPEYADCRAQGEGYIIPGPAQRDWHRFLYDTEVGYWPEMSRFIKGELKAKSLVLGSATGFSPWPVQAMLDVVDAHSYWQHPRFPHRPWDQNDWTVENKSMAGEPGGGQAAHAALEATLALVQPLLPDLLG